MAKLRPKGKHREGPDTFQVGREDYGRSFNGEKTSKLLVFCHC
jgi:hypothetical protein